MDPSQQAAQLVTAAEQRGYDRGKAEAVSVAQSARGAAASLRAEADSCTAMASVFGKTVPIAGTALTQAAATLRAAATKLGG